MTSTNPQPICILRTKSVGEILSKAPPRKPRHHEGWGNWRLDAERLCLEYVPKGIWRYEIDLERIHDSASLLDWIFQVHGHSFHLQWPSDVMHDLLDALNAIFHPQANLCSFGIGKQIKPTVFLRERTEAAGQ